MKFTLIDYSEIYFTRICKTTIPPERGGKFVHIENEHTEFLILSPAGLSSFHANIVERFCMLHKIKGKYTTKRMDNYEIIDPDWIIKGGGKWSINDNQKRLHLYDKSGVYGNFDHAGLKSKILASGNLSGYDIRITV